MSFYLKLLNKDFICNTTLNILPNDIIEYIISEFIIKSSNKSIINSYALIFKGIKQRFYFIWKNYYKIILKLEYFNILPYNINYNHIIKS